MSSAMFTSHIKGGFITVERTDKVTNSFVFIVNGYSDSHSAVPFGTGTFDFGDGQSLHGDFEMTRQVVNDDLELVQLRIAHTYSGYGTYTVHYTEESRNANLINLANSGGQAFSVSYALVLDSMLGFNNAPEITISHLVSQVFNKKTFPTRQSIMFSEHEGDRLLFKLVKPLRGINENVAGYILPPIEVNRMTGNLTCFFVDDIDLNNNHHDYVEYLVALSVTEYRLIDGQLYFLGEQIIDFNLAYQPEEVDSSFEFAIEYSSNASNECLLSNQSAELFVSSGDCSDAALLSHQKDPFLLEGTCENAMICRS